MRSYSICLMPGDGIGPEVIGAAREVLTAVAGMSGAVDLSFDEHRMGHEAYSDGFEPLSETAIQAALTADGVLVGAVDTVSFPEHVAQPTRTLRERLEVRASVRPSRNFRGVPSRFDGVDLVVVREVTEGLYAGIEEYVGQNEVRAARVITRGASSRAARVAFEAAAGRRKKVTVVHKLGALPLSDGMFVAAAREVADEYPDVELELRNVDACAMEMVEHPERLDVVLSTNAFGDILSDVAAGVAGGIGIAPSACVGTHGSYFEPVHGTAPDIAGRGIANPMAAILTAAMMLRHLGEEELAVTVEDAVERVLVQGRHLTADLGGEATGAEVTRAVIGQLTVGGRQAVAATRTER
ncbi:isocitrate/isopropylmalate dehydrogenase family protein [Georgenia ruanii]|uniref:NAD-dependent isocitrate dehydrogenase n=1 Tax=Georgenia ruanii TaxID=348442 RepID=A0A7J9UXF8_9MICO|nr:isocitrate/isopropylmalate family dehydrogenase [Georgenia ruanii]MPV89307.1 NAD-dependent isocitrate dehydrogenase [Georgenia ruanii]